MVKKFFIKARKIRNDIEDIIADFLKLFQSKKVDKAEIALLKVVIQQGITTATSGSTVLNDEQLTVIAEEVVKGLNGLNEAAQKQLRKR